MAQQARSEATRRKILTAAMELFDENGYTNTGLGDIIERAQLTKGALYYHFDSKESLADAIITEGAIAVFTAIDAIHHSTAPALESLIHSSFVVGEIVTNDPMARTGSQLMRALAEFNSTANQTYAGMCAVLVDQARQATTEGDLLADVDPEALAELLLSSYLGAELMSIGPTATDGLATRMRRIWSVLVPRLVDPASVPYFMEFLEREALRQLPPARADT